MRRRRGRGGGDGEEWNEQHPRQSTLGRFLAPSGAETAHSGQQAHMQRDLCVPMLKHAVKPAAHELNHGVC